MRTSLIDFRMFFQFKLTLDSKYLVSMEVSQSCNHMPAHVLVRPHSSCATKIC